LSPVYDAAARDVLERLATKVPSWLDRSPVRGEAGYLVAADAVLRALTKAEENGRSALSDDKLASALGPAKPVGVSIADVLSRLRRDKLIRATTASDGSPWRSAAPAGRRLLSSRDGTAASDEWRVTDAQGLAELIFREHRPGREGFRPAVQAIGRLADRQFDALADELRAAGLLESDGEDRRLLSLTTAGARFAEDRVRETLPRHTLVWELVPPPLPHVRGLPVRVDYDDRWCSCRHGHAAWLTPSSKTKLHATLRRDGAVDWECRCCLRRWLIFLLAHLPNGRPAFEAPDQGVFARPIWRPR
jgi:hypothetical protein